MSMLAHAEKCVSHMKMHEQTHIFVKPERTESETPQPTESVSAREEKKGEKQGD